MTIKENYTEEPQKQQYKYYPSGDRDPLTRNQRRDLVFYPDKNEWRYVGHRSGLPEKILMDMRAAVEIGRAKIYKLDVNGQVNNKSMVNGEEDVRRFMPPPTISGSKS